MAKTKPVIIRGLEGRTGRITQYEMLIYEKLNKKVTKAPVFIKRFGSALAYEVKSHKGWVYIRIGQGAQVNSEAKALRYSAKVMKYLSSLCGTPHLIGNLIVDDPDNKALLTKFVLRNHGREELDLKIQDCSEMLAESSIALYNAAIKLEVAYKEHSK